MDGTQFDFSYASGVTEQQILGFEMAGEIWSQHLADDVVINIHVEVTDLLPENVIGGALPGIKKDVNIDKLWKELSEDISTADDITALNHLSTNGKEFAIRANGEELGKTKSFKVTNANGKALDIIKSDSHHLDGYILMSDLSGQTNVQWDYDPLRNDELANNSLDFVSVALHEVGHILGFVSGVDDEGWLNVVTEANAKNKEIKDDSMKFITPLDLFRYSSESSNYGQIDLSTGGDAYFSIDGGNTNLGDFSTGEYKNLGGDGYQASHWKHDGENPIGIMDPVLKMGQRRGISTLDTLAMDVTGWDVVNPGQLNWQELYDNAVESAEDALVEDRTKDVEKMIEKSSTYHGRRSKSSRRSGSSVSWQLGLWQNIKFQTLDVEVESNLVQPEFYQTEVLIDRFWSGFDSRIADRNELNDAVENSSDKRLDVEEVVTQLIDNGEIVVSKSATLDLDVLAKLPTEQSQDILNLDNELLVMPVG